jgi:predicted PurR-regulated permease PerM
MHRTYSILIIVLTLMITSQIYGKDIPFTQEDRDRLIRLETKIEAIDQRIGSVEQNVNQRIDDMNQRIDDLRGEMNDLKTFMLWGFGILFGGMAVLMTVVIWDRRTALSPVIRRNKELEERVETVFKEYAKIEPKFAKILKAVGLM